MHLNCFGKPPIVFARLCLETKQNVLIYYKNLSQDVDCRRMFIAESHHHLVQLSTQKMDAKQVHTNNYRKGRW